MLGTTPTLLGITYNVYHARYPHTTMLGSPPPTVLGSTPTMLGTTYTMLVGICPCRAGERAAAEGKEGRGVGMGAGVGQGVWPKEWRWVV